MRNFFKPLGLGTLFLLLLNFNAQAQFAVEWDKTIGGNQEEYFSSLTETPDGNYLLAGTSSSEASFERTAPSRGGKDYWVLKVNPEGNILWDKAYGGSGEDELQAVLNTPDGGFLLAGSSSSAVSGEKTEPSKGGIDYWLVKTDASGQLLWEHTYGGNADDRLQAIAPIAGGGYLLSGYSASGISGDKSEASRGGTDFWLIRIDAEGNKLWDKTYGGNEDEQLWALTAAEDGSFLVGGTSLSGATGNKTEASRGEQDFWLLRIDGAGQPLWDKTLGGAGYDALQAIALAANGDIMVGGFSHSNTSGDKSEDRLSEEYYSADFWLLRLNGQGNILWDKTLGGEGYDRLTSILPTAGDGFLLGGYSFSNSSVYKSENSQGSADYWILGIDESGHKLWDKGFGGSGSDLLADMLATAGGGYLLAGRSSGYASGDKSEDKRGYGFYDYWLVKLEQSVSTPPVFARPEVLLEWDMAYEPVPGSLGEGEMDAVAATDDGGYVLGVTTPYRNYSRNDYGLLKIDAEGNRRWEKFYGGSHRDHTTAVLALPDGGYLLGGYSYSDASLDKSEDKRGEWYSPDYWVIRLDAEGNKRWDRTYGSAGDDYLYEVLPTADGGFLLAGNTNAYGASYDKSEEGDGFWVVRIDASGNKRWDRTFNGTGSVNLTAATGATDGSGFLLGGGTYGGPGSRGGSDYFVVAIDNKGDKLWERTFGGHTAEIVRGLAPVQGGGYLIGGWSPSGASGDKSQDNRGYNDFWVIRVDADGTMLWEQIYGGNSSDYLWDMIATEDGGIVLAGESYSDISFEKSEERRGQQDYWTLKIDKEGNKLWDKTAGGASYEDFVGLTESKEGGILMVGTSRSGATADKTVDPPGETDYWLVKINDAAHGLLSGGGTFDSPAGTYFPEPFKEGRAHFGFGVHSREGGRVSGALTFQFPELRLSFRSTELDWLAIAGKRAKLTGSGALNREEGYRFFASVEEESTTPIDEDDQFRLMIWAPDGRMVYDNQRSDAWHAPTSIAISAGNINVRPMERRALPEAAGRQQQYTYQPEGQSVLEGFNAYPVPLNQEGLWLDFPEARQERELQVRIYDMQGKSKALKTLHLGRTAEQHFWELDYKDWPSGVYILRISGKGLLHQQKLIK